jgi:hypothetical protein
MTKIPAWRSPLPERGPLSRPNECPRVLVRNGDGLARHECFAASKGIRSVPVVEVGGSRLVGNATTEQLAEMIAGATASHASVPA